MTAAELLPAALNQKFLEWEQTENTMIFYYNNVNPISKKLGRLKLGFFSYMVDEKISDVFVDFYSFYVYVFTEYCLEKD